MADLRDWLRRAAPAAPDFDERALRRTIARRRQRHITLAVGMVVIAVAAVATVAVASNRRNDYGNLLVGPPTTIPAPSVPSSTVPTTTTAPFPTRATTAPVQTSAMPAEAFVAVGPSLVAIDTHDVSKRRTLTIFHEDAAINWITVDRPRGRVFFGVTSGCDPGVNGMYEMATAGGEPRKIAPSGNRAAVSPDGTKIAYSRQTDGCGSRDLVLQDVATGHQQVFSGSRSINVGGWSGDGQSLFLGTYDQVPTLYRFGPFAEGAQVDAAERWDTGVTADSGGGRVAIQDWCTGTTVGHCIVHVRTRADGPPAAGNNDAAPDYSFGRQDDVLGLTIDSSGQWPLLVVNRDPRHDVVRYFAAGAWHDLAAGNAADW